MGKLVDVESEEFQGILEERVNDIFNKRIKELSISERISLTDGIIDLNTQTARISQGLGRVEEAMVTKENLKTELSILATKEDLDKKMDNTTLRILSGVGEMFKEHLKK